MRKEGLRRGKKGVSSHEWSVVSAAEALEAESADVDGMLNNGRDHMGALAGVDHEPAVDEEAIKTAVVMMLKAIGEDPTREGLRETPRRIAEMYAELFSGLKRDPAEVLGVTFDEG